MKGLMWYRRDFRLRDDAALAAACAECREVVPLFVFDEPLLHHRIFGAACVNFMLGCLEELRQYVRRYVPDLRHVGSRRIREPHLMPVGEQLRAGCRIGADYPSPIVDHGQARQEYPALGRQEMVR
ncbi:deoxyribodipyrimidine photo-lyase [Nitrospira sp. Nam80]